MGDPLLAKSYTSPFAAPTPTPRTLQRLRVIHGPGPLVGAVTKEENNDDLEKMGGDGDQPHRRQGQHDYRRHHRQR
jgi:hypothetical protein